VKLDRLRKSGALPRERKVTSAVLWLAVLEPTTRVHRLLAAIDVDVDRLREVLLTALADGAPTPTWPERVQHGAIHRVLRPVLGGGDVAR